MSILKEQTFLIGECFKIAVRHGFSNNYMNINMKKEKMKN